MSTMTGGIIRVGIAGWTYEPWRGVFYPKGLRREQELEYAASQFRAIEINGTFYGHAKARLASPTGRTRCRRIS